MSVYRQRRVVQFGECDPAGAVYYPVFFNWFHQAMEAWFDEAIGVPYVQLLERVGFPAAHTSADFKKICRFGDVVFVELRVERLGSRSLTLAFAIVGDAEGDLRLTGKVVCVAVPRSEGGGFVFQPAEIPADLRDKISAFQREEAAAGK